MRPADPPPQPPEWLVAFGRWLTEMLAPVGRFFAWIASFMPDLPFARFLLWSMIAVAAVFVVWIVVDRVRSGEWRLRRRTKQDADDGEVDQWQPDAAPARAWLQEADVLAAQGRYAEAVHHLLLRAVEDIARRRPQLVRPALTSRELGDAAMLPGPVRGLFSRIALLVERSLFGGRPVDADDWGQARTAYADLVLPGSWRG